MPNLVSHNQSTIGISDSQLKSEKYLEGLGRAALGDACACIEPKDSDAEPADACGQGGLDARLGRYFLCSIVYTVNPDATPLFLQRFCNAPATFLQRSFERDKKARQSTTCPEKARHAADGRLLLSKGGA